MVAETRIITKFLRERPDDSWTIDAALGNGAYDGLRKALAMTPEDIVAEVTTSGLRGRGGAGFGTGQKWSFLPKDVFPRYLAVNGDEGEPSTFKDHMLVERDPHQIIEGVDHHVVRDPGHHAFIYLRGEFALRRRAARAGARRRVRHGLRRQEHPRLRASTSRSSCTAARAATSPVTRRGCSRASRASARCRASSRRSPRCRVCTRRPRSSTTSRRCRPCRTSSIAAASGTRRWASTAPPGTRIFSVSGNVERPGNYEVELGMTFRELIDDLAGGDQGRQGLGFFIPGGASSPWLIEEHLDAPLDMDSVQSELKTMLGSGAIMVFDDDRRPAAGRVAHRQVLRPRVVRQVHAVPRGLGLAREGALPDVARLRAPRGPRPHPRVRQQPRAGALVAAGHDDDLPARARAPCRRR